MSIRRAMNADVVARHLDGHWEYTQKRGIDVTDVAVDRAYVSKRSVCVICYHVTLRHRHRVWKQTVFGEIVDGSVQSYADRVIRRLAKPRRGQLLPNDPLHQVCGLPKLNLVLRCVGLDEQIDGLCLLHSPSRALDTLQLDGFDQTRSVNATLLAHRLHKRCVIRLANGKPADHLRPRRQLIAKLYKMHSKRPIGIYAAMMALNNAAEGEMANVLCVKPTRFDASLNAIFMDDVPGNVVNFAVAHNADHNARLCGQLLGALHGMKLTNTDVNLPTHLADDEANMLEDWLNRTEMVFPEYAHGLQRARGCLDDIRDLAPLDNPTLLHRDFHEKQIVVGAQGATLLDFDTLCWGDSAIDVGNFLAHARLASIQSPAFGRDDCESACRAFTDAYANRYEFARTAKFQKRVDCYRNATLLRLACLALFQPKWQNRVNALLGAIE